MTESAFSTSGWSSLGGYAAFQQRHACTPSYSDALLIMALDILEANPSALHPKLGRPPQLTNEWRALISPSLGPESQAVEAFAFVALKLRSALRTLKLCDCVERSHQARVAAGVATDCEGVGPPTRGRTTNSPTSSSDDSPTTSANAAHKPQTSQEATGVA